MISKRKSLLFIIMLCIFMAVFVCFALNARGEDTNTGQDTKEEGINIQNTAVPGMLGNTTCWFNSGQAKISMKKVTKVIFSDSTVPQGYTASWDASATYDGSVMAYLVGTEVTIVGNGTGSILANPNSSWMFCGCESLECIENISLLDTAQVTDMSGMFSQCISLKTLDLSGFDTGNVTNMYGMFMSCKSLTSLNLSAFDTGNVKNMGYMFDDCSGLKTLDLSGFDTGKVTDMTSMFMECTSLTSLNLSGFDTGNVTTMTLMFSSCFSLTSLNLSDFDTGNVTNMNNMFSHCYGLTTLDLSGFNTENVTRMYGMFYQCTSLKTLDLTGFDTGNVTDMRDMFNWCTDLTELYISDFDTENVTEYTFLFFACNKLTGGNGKKYVSSMDSDLSVAKADSHETPGLFTYNGADKCTVHYDLNYPGASEISFTQQVKQGAKITVGGSGGQVTDPERKYYTFLGWSTSPNGGEKLQAGSVVQTNSSSLTLYACWEGIDVGYVIDWQDEAGTKTRMTAEYGAIQEPITPIGRAGFVFHGIYSEPNGLGKMYVSEDGTWCRAWDKTEEVTIYAFWSRADRADYFTDVSRTDWFYGDVYFMYYRGLMLGMGNSPVFSPYSQLTREQFATILYRMAHNPGVEYEQKFNDVHGDEWYATPITWAYKNGIIRGYVNGNFGVGDPITREQLAVMIYNYAKWKGGIDTSSRADLSGFVDSGNVSDWAYEAVQWAVSKGIISGKNGGTVIDPAGNAARCECAAMVHRYCDKAK